jgi:hypothetical protein
VTTPCSASAELLLRAGVVLLELHEDDEDHHDGLRDRVPQQGPQPDGPHLGRHLESHAECSLVEDGALAEPHAVEAPRTVASSVVGQELGRCVVCSPCRPGHAREVVAPPHLEERNDAVEQPIELSSSFATIYVRVCCRARRLEDLLHVATQIPPC